MIQALAGLAPVDLHVNKYMKWAALHTYTLPLSHFTRTVLSEYWNVEDFNYVALYLLEDVSDKVKTPFRYIDHYGCMSSKTFDLYHDKCRSGHCIIDVYAK